MMVSGSSTLGALNERSLEIKSYGASYYHLAGSSRRILEEADDLVTTMNEEAHQGEPIAPVEQQQSNTNTNT